MTVRDLLTHTSGLTYGFMERTNIDAAYRRMRVSDGTKTLRDMVDKLATLPLEFSPGTRWNYSLSTDVVGYLVEQMSGQPFDQFLQERILGPLGMIDTGFSVPPDKVQRFAANYTRGADGRIQLYDDPQDSAYIRPCTYFSAAAGSCLPRPTTCDFAKCFGGAGSSTVCASWAARPSIS